MRKTLLFALLNLVVAFFLIQQVTAADTVAPATATKFGATFTPNALTLTFEQSADKDLSGYMVVRMPGIGNTLPAVKDGTNYKQGNTLTVSTPYEPWVVISNDGQMDNTINLTNGAYTYLIYMRDRSRNYSTPSRIVVNNATVWTTANLSPDLLILTGGELKIASNYKLTLVNNGNIAWFGGNLHNDGIFDITSPLTVPAQRALNNGLGTISVKNGGALYVEGSFNSMYNAAKLDVNSGGLVNVLPNGLFKLDQGQALVQAGGTMLVDGTMEILANSTGLKSAGNLTFTRGGRLNQRKNMAIPTATWQDGSVMAYYGDFWQGTATAGLNQDFYNFVWSLPANQGQDITLPCDMKVRNTLRVENTSGKKLVLNSCNNYNFGSIETTDKGLVSLPEGFKYRVAAPDASLPVELISFKITADTQGAAKLAWSTATEINNEKFEIERSEDGKTWYKVGSVKGAGNTSVKRTYTYTDTEFKTLASTEVYYRLRQVDFDGQFSVSKVVRLQPKAGTTGISQIYFNAGNSALEVDYQNTGATAMHVVLTDANGRVIINQTYTLKEAAGRLVVPVQQLTDGLYVTKAAAGQSYLASKFLR